MLPRPGLTAGPPPPLPPEPNSHREYTGWVLLFILFAITLAGALVGSLTPSAASANVDHEQRISTLRSSFDLAASYRKFAPAAADQSKTEALKALLEQVAPGKNKNSSDANLWLVATYELNQKVAIKEIPAVASAPYQKIYGSAKLTKSQVARISKQLPNPTYLDQVALAHANQKAGDSGPHDALGDPAKGWIALGGILLGVALTVVGVFAGIAVFSAQLAGRITYRGHPQSPISRLTADRLALRAAQVFLAFFIISLIPQIFGERRFSDSGVTLATGLATMAAVIGLARLSIAGERFSLAALGYSTRDLARHIGLGLLAYVIELPLALIVGLIGTKIFSFLPEPHHPASDMLATASPLAIFAVFFSACVVAPFWEEMMFRGMLFPAISRLVPNPSKRVLIGALISSLLFASVHPQGIALWFALGTVGLASCVLVQYSRSMVPSMVMHAAHNFTLLVVGLVMTR